MTKTMNTSQKIIKQNSPININIMHYKASINVIRNFIFLKQ
jgi:hypothetical protein